MLIDFSIENCYSIREKITFSMESTGGNKLLGNTIKINDIERLVRSVAIYGANASGKSNLLKGLFFMWKMIKDSHKFNVDKKIPRVPFKLDSISKEKASRFEINIIQQGIKYRYGFSCKEEGFIEEYLYYWPKGKKSLIFKRNKEGKFTFNVDKGKQNIIEKQMIPNTLYLSRATQLGLDKTKPVYDFFTKDLLIVINNTHPVLLDITINSIYENEKLKDKIVEMMKRTDFGGIDDIIITKTKGSVKEIKFDGDGTVSHRDLEDHILDVKFIHKIKGKNVPLDITEESAGTQKIFSMLGPIFDILENGKVAIIDEIDLSLHPKIARFLIQLFNSRHNKKNAQLIFTTHNSSLLNNELFRIDQFCFCEKELNKSTEIISMRDYNIRQEANFEKAYIQGRFGANPFVDETYVK